MRVCDRKTTDDYLHDCSSGFVQVLVFCAMLWQLAIGHRFELATKERHNRGGHCAITIVHIRAQNMILAEFLTQISTNNY